MRIQNKSALAISILIPLAVGSVSALIGRNMLNYAVMSKPFLSPPAFLFPVVWTILYILMGFSSYIIYTSGSPDTGKALVSYAVQLFFNFFWSIIFFTLSLYLPAFLWLVVLVVLILTMIYQFYQISPFAAFLQIPYFLWCLFAAYLNLAIYLIN